MKKFLSYVLTFVIMFMLSATGTIWLAKTANNTNNNNFVPDGGNQGGAEQTSFFSGILSTFNEHKQFNVSGDIEVEYDNKNIDLSIFASVDIQDQTNIKVDALLKTQIDGRTFAVSVIYYNSTIFVSFNNVSVKAEVKNLADLGTKLLDLFPELKQKVGGADLSAKMEEMLPSLMGALNNPVEETLPNGDKKNTIDFENLAVASIITDSEGMIKGADVSTYELYGIKANLSLSIAFSDSVVIENPETRLVKKNYLELSRVMNIVSDMKTWQNFETNVNLSLSSTYGDFDFGFNVLSRIKDNAFMMKMNSSSESKLENMFIKFIDNNAYVCFGDVKILISDELVNLAGNKIQDLVSKLIGTNGKFAFNDELISSLTEKAKGVNISNIFEILDKIKKLEVSNDQLVLDTEYGIVKVSLSHSKIENIVASFKYKENQISFEISFEKSEKEISAENKEEYFNLYELAKENAKFYSSSAFDIKANLELLKNSDRVALLSGNVSFDFRKPYLNTNLMLDIGQEFNISAIYEGETAYVQIDNVFVKMNKADFIKLLDEFNIENNIEEKKQETLEKLRNELQKQFENMKFEDIKEKLDAIKEVKINASGIEVSVDLSVFGLSGIGHFVLNIENNIVSDIYLENFGFNEYVISGEIEVLSNTISEKEFDKTKYLDAYALYQNVKSLQSLNEAKASVVLSSILEGNRVSLSATVGMNKASEYLFANGKLTLNGEKYDFDVQAFEKQIYAKLQNILVKFNLDWIKELAGGMVNKEQATKMVNGMLEKLKSYLPENLQSFDVSLLKSVKDFKINTNEIYAKLDGNILGLSTDITFKIEIRNNQISSFELLNFITKEGNEVSVKANFYFTSVKPANVEKEKYLDVETLLNNVLNTLESDKLNANISASLYSKDGAYYNKEYDFVVDLNKQKTAYTNNMFALIEAVYQGKKISLETILQDNTIYANLNNFKVKVATDKILETVHTILQKFGKDQNQYDNIISKVIDILNDGNIKEILSDLDFDSGSGNMKEKLNISKLVNTILNAQINANKIVLVLENDAIENLPELQIEIDLDNSALSKIKIDKFEFKNGAVDIDVKFNIAEKQIKTLGTSEKEEYIRLDRLADLAVSTYETLKNKVISGTMHIDFIFGGEHNIVLAEYGIKYISEENRLSGYIKASFNGVTLNVFYVDSVFYVDFGGVNNNADNRLQIKAEFDELNDVLAYIKGKTGLEIDFDFNEIRDVLAGVKDIEVDFEQIRDMVFGLDLGFVESAEFGESSFEANFKGDLSIFINFKETVHQVVFKTGVVVAQINCENFNDFAFDSLDKTTYNSYTVITNAVDSVMNTLKTQPLEFFANLGVYKNSELNFNVDAGYQDEILLLNIKGMKIQIQRQKLAEILSYALSSMGIDPSIISFIGNVSDAKDLDTDNLQELVPELNLGNPFAMLKFLKGIVFKEGVFEIEIDSKLLGNENASDMKISLETANNWISSLKVSNVFVKADTALNISLVFERRINESYSNYIDLSNSADLVKAFVNTSALNEYRITGNIKLGVGSTDLKNVYVKVDARVILDENKNPIVQVDVSNYPLIGFVNGKNTNGVGGITGSTQRARTISVYYKDGQMLLKTSDEKWAAYKKYDRVTKIEPSYLMNNLKYYMQWLLGFEDYIQDKINSAIDTSNANKQQATDRGELDLSNIITKYEKQGNTHLLDINIGKIAYNDDIGTLSIKLTTVNNAKTNNKDYIGYLDIDLDMLGGTIVLKTDAGNKLQLENIVGGDSTVSVSTAESELDGGTFVLDGEYERKGNGSFGQTNRNSVTITLDNNGGVGTTSISGSVGDRLTLPAPTKVVDNGVTRETYKFVGYYDGNGKLYTRNCFPRQNITLYARFELEKVEEYRALVLEKNNGEENQTISKLQGSLITVDALADYVFDNGIYHTDFTFVGWSLCGEIVGKNVTITLSENTTLVAVWSENTRYYRTISFVTNNNETMKDITKLEGETLEIVSLDDYISYDDNYKYVYTFIGWFDNSSFDGEQVKTYNFDRDLTIYAKFDFESFEIRTINIVYAGNVVHTEKVLLGEKFVAPNKEMFKDTTIYYNEDGQVLTDLTVYSNETWTIRNYFNYKVISTFGHKIGSTVEGINEVYNGYLNGETISLSKLERAMTVGSEYDTEYEFKGYRIVETGEMITLNSNEQDFVLPTFDATIEAVFENIEWCTITFNTSWSKPSGWSESRTRKIIHDSYPTAVASVRVRRGSSVDVSKFNSTCTVRYKVVTISGTYDFFVWSWNYSDPDCIFNVTPNDKVNNRTKLTTITVNSNTTLYATWSATKR